MQYIQITIPEPCTADWNAMTPKDTGRHCAQCCKTVIDFTGCTTEDIAVYLYAQRHQSVCGRFNQQQLDVDYLVPDTYIYQVQQSNLHFLKKMAALIVFVFCISGTAYAQHQTLGEPALNVLKKQQAEQQQTHTVVGKPLQGLVAPIPQPLPDTTHPIIQGKMMYELPKK